MESGKFYHIFNRGNNRELIFRSEENYHYFLKKYKYYLDLLVEPYAYCLMPNHFHFLIRVKDYKNLSTPGLSPLEKGFRDFFISYAKSFNKRYKRSGSLFQYKFKRKEIESESYFVRLVFYIHANPIKAGLCARFEDWKFSSYNALLSHQPTALNRATVLEWFGGRESFIEYHAQNLKNLGNLDFKSLEDF